MDYEKIELAISKLDNSCCNISSVDNALVEVSHEEMTYEEESSKLISEFLDSQFGSPEELEMKKLMVVAAVAAGDESNPVDLASNVDASAVYSKTSYKVSAGDLDIIEATDIIIDHGVARLDSIIQTNLDMDIAGEIISETIASAFPPAKAAKPFIKVIIKKAEPLVRKCITEGLRSVASYAKQTVRNVTSQLKSFAKSLIKA